VFSIVLVVHTHHDTSALPFRGPMRHILQQSPARALCSCWSFLHCSAWSYARPPKPLQIQHFMSCIFRPCNFMSYIFMSFIFSAPVEAILLTLHLSTPFLPRQVSIPGECY